MKNVIIAVVLLIVSGCAATYSKEQIDADKEKFIAAANEAFGLAYACTLKAFEKEIAGCQKKKQVYDIKEQKCVDRPKDEPKK